MNPALNREASGARVADLRRRAGRDAIALAEMKAANAESASLPTSKIAAMLRLLQPRRIRRTLPRVVAADIDSVGTGSGLLPPGIKRITAAPAATPETETRHATQPACR
jgi:hypothetical protein